MPAKISVDAIETRAAELLTASISREGVQNCLSAYAEYLGISTLQFDDNGFVEIVIDDDMPLALVHMPGLPGVIASVPMPDEANARGQLLRRLLQANLSWDATAGGVFGMLPERRELCFCQVITMHDFEAETFDAALNRFVEVAGEWRLQIGLYLDALDDEGAEADTPTNLAPENLAIIRA